MENNKANVFIYWDFDDVLGKTHAQFIFLLKLLFDHDAATDVYLTPANTDGHLAVILNKATFMRNTAFDYQVIAAWKAIQENFPQVVHGLATHRGYHPDGEANTMALLDEHGFKFASYHFIDPAVHGKDKMVYLRERHAPDDIIILIDDNTFYEHDQYPNASTVLIDKPWNKHVVTTSPELRVQTSGIYEAVEALLCFYTLKAMTNERAA